AEAVAREPRRQGRARRGDVDDGAPGDRRGAVGEAVAFASLAGGAEDDDVLEHGAARRDLVHCEVRRGPELSVDVDEVRGGEGDVHGAEVCTERSSAGTTGFQGPAACGQDA